MNGPMDTGAMDHDDSKEAAILSAAMEVFIEKGSYGARMQEIADRAGVNKNLLHYYFRKKENIYRRVTEHVFLTFFGAIDSAVSDSDSFPVVLRKFVDTIIDVVDANPRIPLFVMAEMSQGGKTAREIMGSVLGKRGAMTMPERMVGLINAEVAAGRIRPVDPPQLIITMLGACIYFFVAEPIVKTILAKVQPERQYVRKTFIDERKESIFNVIYYGLKNRDDSPAT